MYAVFTLTKGAWKFYARLSTQQSLDMQKKYLDDEGVKYIVCPIATSDFSKIDRIQEELNA